MNLKKCRYILLFVVLVVFNLPLNAQINISATIKDSNTKENLPFVNIVLKSKPHIGVATDEDGSFILKSVNANDSLLISMLGYEKTTVSIKSLPGKHAVIYLIPNELNLNVVVIKSGLELAHVLLRNILSKRDKNNTENMSDYSSFIATKSITSFSNINIKKNSWFEKNFKNNLIQLNDSICMLPTLYSDEIILKKVDLKKKIIDTALISNKDGIGLFDTQVFDEITDEMMENTNFYNNYIPILGKYIPSPIGSNSLFHYKLFVIDSIDIDGNKRYKVEFLPKNKLDVIFYGNFWVDFNTAAITEVTASLSEKANINFLKGFKIHNTYQKINDTLFFYNKKRSELVFDYNLLTDSIKNLTINIIKTRNYSNTIFNFSNTHNYSEFNKTNLKTIIHEINKIKQSDTTDNEIYNKITELKNNPIIIFSNKLSYIGLNGYYNAGKIDIGPLTDVYRSNRIEGRRFSFGMRTNEKLSKNKSIGGFIGYGFHDKTHKYGINGLMSFKSKWYNKLSIDFWNDIDNLSLNDNLYLIKENSTARNEDNIVSSFFALRKGIYLSKRINYTVSFEHDIAKGINEKFIFQNNTIWGNSFIQFTNNKTLIYNELNYIIRFSFDEKYFEEYFHRIYIGNKRPIINVKLTAGKYQMGDYDQFYYKIHSTFKHRLNFATGVFKYIIEAGLIIGKVPFPLLEIHRGNQTLGLARFSFNLLNNMEYASDKYISLQGTYQTNGYLFNRIPLLKKLNLRENASIKIIYGSLSNKHKEITKFPTPLSEVKNPYIELGFGISNIFKIMRIEYLWRLTDRNKINIPKSGIRFRFEVTF